MIKHVKAPGREGPRAPGRRAVPPKNGAPKDDAIRAKAYELFERRGGEPGHELDDWLEAERELQHNA